MVSLRPCRLPYSRLTYNRYCHERGRTRESDDFSGVAQRLCGELKAFYPLPPHQEQSHFPSERDIDDILAEIHHNRGVMANEINRPKESLEYLSKFNSMMIRDLGDRKSGTDMRLALSFNELGCAYMLRNDYVQAEKCFEQSISSMEKLENYERWQVSLPGVNLGVVYWLTGRHADAIDILSRGLRDREKKFGSNDQESFMYVSINPCCVDLANFDKVLDDSSTRLGTYTSHLATTTPVSSTISAR
jgi:tetratricopeptide (TPR) repeat protein